MSYHVRRSQDFDISYIKDLFEKTEQIKYELRTDKRSLKNRLHCHLAYCFFYEPSTRTRFSFSTACRYLGMDVVETESAGQFSSMAKGETLEDSIKVMCEYGPSVIILRHPSSDAASRAAEVSDNFGVWIINAGSGSDQHPTQALLDLYTIHKELGRLDNLVVVVGNDIRFSRASRSLIYLLSKFSGIHFKFVSPEPFRLKDDIREHLEESRVSYEEHFEMRPELFDDVDVVYWLRAQTEKFSDNTYREVRPFIFTFDLAQRMKKESIIHHPLPRKDELAKAVDNDPRAVYFNAVHNGLLVRMALIDDMFTC